MSPKAPLEQRKKIYRSLCYVLSERADQIDWEEYGPADWELFAQMAEREGVAPLMYWKFKRLKLERLNVPVDVFARLKRAYYNTLAQNTLMYRELERILRALDEAGIAVIVLKGAALAATVYEDIGLRPMGDLDLLVKRENLDQAVSALEPLGFKVSGNPGLAAWLDRIAQHDVHLLGGVNGETIIELHWNLVAGDADWRSPSLEWFWEQTKPFVSPSANANLIVSDDLPDHNSPLATRSFILEPKAHCLYLSAHLMLQHGNFGGQLLWLYDVHLLTSDLGPQFDWNVLLDRSELYGWTPALYATLDELHRRFNMAVPGSIAPGLAAREYLAHKSGRFIQRKNSRLQTLATHDLDRVLSFNIWDGLLFSVATIFPSPTYVRWRYQPNPGWLWPLCYPYRWFRMLREAVYTLSKILLPSRS